MAQNSNFITQKKRLWMKWIAFVLFSIKSCKELYRLKLKRFWLECCQNRKLFLAIAVCLTVCCCGWLFFSLLLFAQMKFSWLLRLYTKRVRGYCRTCKQFLSSSPIFDFIFKNSARSTETGKKKTNKTKQNCLLLVYLT